VTKTLKTILIICAVIVLVGAAYLIGRGASGGDIQQSINFSISVKASGSFTLTINPADVSIVKGDPLSFAITNLPSGGFDAQIEYAVSGLPAGSYSFSVNPVNAGQVTTLTVDSTKLASNTTYVCSLIGVDR